MKPKITGYELAAVMLAEFDPTWKLAYLEKEIEKSEIASSPPGGHADNS